MKKTISVIVTIVFAVGILSLLIFEKNPNDTMSSASGDNMSIAPSENVTVRDGIQYVAIRAKGGYMPTTTRATGELPTKLVMTTDGTYDCSIALVVRTANFRDYLPPSGETIIDLLIPEKGSVIQGTCTMGMYGFQIKFD